MFETATTDFTQPSSRRSCASNYLADLGAWVWGNMKDKAGDMWRSNDDAIGEEQHVGTYFLNGLAKLQACRDIKVNLVGHSAGSIVICKLLAAAAERHAGVSFGDVIFLAPAVRSDIAFAEVASQRGRYNAFRQYTMSDSFERDDSLVTRYLYTITSLFHFRRTGAGPSGSTYRGNDAPCHR